MKGATEPEGEGTGEAGEDQAGAGSGWAMPSGGLISESCSNPVEEEFWWPACEKVTTVFVG